MNPYRLCVELDRFASSCIRVTGRAPHIHVGRDDCEAKFWLDPVRLERSRGFRRNEINQVWELVQEHREAVAGELA